MRIQAVTDVKEIQRIRSLGARMLDGTAQFALSWLTEHRWAVLPFESASHFDEKDASTLSKALTSIGCKELVALATEPLNNFPNCFRVPSSKEGLLDFSENCSHFNFVLVPEHRGFAILCTVYDYFLVGGPVEFVRRAADGDVTGALERFTRFASNELGLVELVNRYGPFLPQII